MIKSTYLSISSPVCLFLSQVSIYEGDKRDCRKFCTTGIDGAMTIWDFKVKMHRNSVLFFVS